MVLYAGKTSLKQHLQDRQKLQQNVELSSRALWEPDPRLCDGSRLSARHHRQDFAGRSYRESQAARAGGGGGGHRFAGTAGTQQPHHLAGPRPHPKLYFVGVLRVSSV